MALDAGMPILPVVISQCDFLDPQKKCFDSGSLRVKFLRPIETEGYTKETMDGLIELTRSKMQEAYREISNITEKEPKKDK